MKEVVGDLRRSQLVSTFGIGSMVDLPSLSGVLMGLDYWDVARCSPISEPRLLRTVQKALNNPGISEIREGPKRPDQGRSAYAIDQHGVPTAVFPRWLRCPLCSTLAPIESGLFKLRQEPYRIDRTRYIHEGCQKRGNRTDASMPAAVPARFVIACDNGHLEDFPWVWYVHHGNPCAAPRLRLFENGVSGEAADVFVRCEGCDKSRPMSDAFGLKSDLAERPCSGYHAHLHASSQECGGKVKAMLIGASNSYFPINISVLSLPITKNPIEPIIQRYWSTLSAVQSEAELSLLRRLGQLNELESYSDDQIWTGIQQLREGAPAQDGDATVDVKRPEWNLLAGTSGPILTERLTTSVSTELPFGFEEQLERVVLVERFTEVRALIGFTRIESAGEMSELDALPAERRAPLSRRRLSWVPGVEVRGEGIFLQFREAEIRRWEARESVRDRLRALEIAHENWCNARPWIPRDRRPAPPTARYAMLHTFSHLLMREMGLRCGYGTASLRERIYCSSTDDPEGAMAGLFIGTASSDSEGTLGGLVALGQPRVLSEILRTALRRAAICSSDPICAGYNAAHGQKLHGASCHSCSFVPETSCERSNSFLDRALVVETLDGNGAAFLSAGP